MTLDQIQVSLKQMPLREMAALAARAGVPYGTVLKIRGGYTQNPRVRTVEALAAQFAASASPAQEVA